ncbi:MAG: tRNA-dihydrouridine synthase [Candidatus Electryoneaceae bacterium]|nr:tRNA-dihydrouridine synthase [Candidatus Electryoneaceae bacterium]
MIETKVQYTDTSNGKQRKTPIIINGWELPVGAIPAPMAGITDSPFRRIVRRYGAGLLYSECISAEGIRRLGQGSLNIVSFTEEERPIAIQLFGSKPDQFVDATAIIAERFNPDIIDINCGCPVKRFVKRSCGGYLMQYPDLIGRIVEETLKNSGLPVSVKLRTGYHKPDETAINAAIAAVEAGASLICVHGRYVRGAKMSDADWDVIGRVKAAVGDIPVVGNGDIRSFADVRRMTEITGCDRVMIGRWALGRPWVFVPFDDPENVAEPDFRQRIDVLLEHYRLMLDHYINSRTAMYRMRKQIGWYIRGIPGAAHKRNEAMQLEQPEEVIQLLTDFQNSLTF